jgi:hypothetical protein
MQQLGKMLIVIGIIIIVAGIVLLFVKKMPFGLGKLPGDIYIKKDNFTFYFPITTAIIISVVLSIIFYIVSKFIK